MSSEELRRAAALMRERAHYAIPSPWHAKTINDECQTWLCETAPDGVEVHTIAMHGFPRTAQHIASWQPAVALAVADSLIAAAAHIESYDCEAQCEPDGCELVVTATRTARTYLGTAS